MFEKQFVWTVAYDDNRMADGLELRAEFAHENDLPVSIMERLGPCSFLEVLIGLSKRLAFSAGGEAPGWAWQLLGNLELHRMTDPLRSAKERKAHELMDTCIWRTYRPDGQGGFFPLAWPDDDMTQVELWYQMSAYIAELHPEHT